jgi:pyochelin biosynthetic protein PchC
VTALVPLAAGRGPALVAFSPAGAGAGTYRPWAERLPDGMALWGVRLPGRESRWSEPQPADIGELAGEVAAEIAALGRPVGLFGHSFGALLAYTVAVSVSPVWLGLSALDPRGGRPELEGDDDELLRTVAGWVHPPMDAHLLRLTLPALRADIALAAAARPVTGPPVACPVSLYGGRDDPHADRDALLRWRPHAAAELSVRQYPGGHGYLVECPEPLMRDVCADLRAAVNRADAGTTLIAGSG